MTGALGSPKSSHKLLVSDAVSGNRECKSPKQFSIEMNSSVDTAIMAYRQHIKEMIHGKRTVGFRKFLNQVVLPTRTKSGSLMQFCELNAVEMSGTRRQLNHWK